MDSKYAIIAAILVAAVMIAAAFIFLDNGNSSEKEDDADASKIAASFSANYSGFFGENFYLDPGYTSKNAKDYYPNGSTSGYGSSDNSFTFKVLDSKKDAKAEFDTNKADYTAQIGKSVMGSTIKGVYSKDKLDDAIGYYNNFNMGTASSYIHYTGYSGKTFFEGYVYLAGKIIEGNADTDALAKAIYDAIKNPADVSRAKKYVEPTPVPDPTPAVDYKGVALRCYNFIDEAQKYGSSSSGYAVTEDSTAMKARLASSDGKYYVDMEVARAESPTKFAADKAEADSKIGTTIMGGKVNAITEAAGADAGYGYYYNGGSVSIMDYSCYKGNYYAHLHLRSATAITDDVAASMAKDLIKALTE